MSQLTDELNAKKDYGYVFLDIKDIKHLFDGVYHPLFVSLMGVSFLLLSLNVMPLVSITVYAYIHLAITALWVGLGHFYKRLKLQHGLINKGAHIYKDMEFS